MRQSAPEQLAVSVQLRGRGLLDLGRDSISHTGQLGLMETTRPYSYRQSGHNDHKVMLIEPAQLALPVDVVRSAAPSLRSSPIYELVRRPPARPGTERGAYRGGAQHLAPAAVQRGPGPVTTARWPSGSSSGAWSGPATSSRISIPS